MNKSAVLRFLAAAKIVAFVLAVFAACTPEEQASAPQTIPAAAAGIADSASEPQPALEEIPLEQDLPLEAGYYAPLPDGFTAMAMGSWQGITAIGTDGTLWLWGGSEDRQSATGTGIGVQPVRIGSASNWVSVSTSWGGNIGIRSDGSLWAWGRVALIPTRIAAGNNWASVSSGGNNAVAIRTDGTMWEWRGWGWLRDGAEINRMVPTQIGRGADWVSVSVNDFNTAAIQRDGSLWMWGNEFFGNGRWEGSDTPVRIGTDNDWASVATGMLHTVAIKTDGSLWAWGESRRGEVGDGETGVRLIPTRIGDDYNWASVSAGGYQGAHNNPGHTLAIRTDGTLWAWGNNQMGQLGDGTSRGRWDDIQLSPVQIGTDTDWASVYAGGWGSLATKTDGSLWAWGGGSSQVYHDDNAVPPHPVPARIGGTSVGMH
jgi:alpha-tubulin suppressor-like RCC1 family protein